MGMGGWRTQRKQLPERSVTSATERSLTNGMRALADQAKNLAWRQEQALVKRGIKGTRDWRPHELKELLLNGSVKGYEADHIFNKAHHPEIAGDPDNIQFLTKAEHTARHSANGGTAKQITGTQLFRGDIYRRATGEEIPGAGASLRTYEQVKMVAQNAAQRALDSANRTYLGSAGAAVLGAINAYGEFEDATGIGCIATCMTDAN